MNEDIRRAQLSLEFLHGYVYAKAEFEEVNELNIHFQNLENVLYKEEK